VGATYFASDLHLTAVEDPIFDCFLDLLERVRGDGARLYLLGDVFETWIGDDDDAPLGVAVARALREVADAGVEIAFAHGNRDFLVGERFAQAAGLRLLGEVECIEVAGHRIALLHGDTLCSDDRAYQQVRLQLRDPAWRAQFLSQSLGDRRAFAVQARARSAAHTSMTAASIMDVNQRSVDVQFAETGAHWMIHGHTHRPAIHRMDGDRRRIVLGDWPHTASWLRIAEDGAAELVFAGCRERLKLC
jgi:UDP-2,3-diacylglucosamine hydrolase